jgi:hypothetical protein
MATLVDQIRTLKKDYSVSFPEDKGISITRTIQRLKKESECIYSTKRNRVTKTIEVKRLY